MQHYLENRTPQPGPWQASSLTNVHYIYWCWYGTKKTNLHSQIGPSLTRPTATCKSRPPHFEWPKRPIRAFVNLADRWTLLFLANCPQLQLILEPAAAKGTWSAGWLASNSQNLVLVSASPQDSRDVWCVVSAVERDGFPCSCPHRSRAI